MQHHRTEPGSGQESVWDYPRPPRLENSNNHIEVICNGVLIADTHRAKRILETSHPPVYYLPPQDVQMAYFISSVYHTYCEWKGTASYYTIQVGKKTLSNAAWYYLQPTTEYASLANYIAIYPAQMDACFVNGEHVQPQAGDFYGGWITRSIVGPFKGSAGTANW